MSEKKHQNRIDRLFRLPPGTMGGASRIEMLGNYELSVEGCKGVLEYDDSIIRFNLGNRQLQIKGRNLTIRVMERNYAEVEGFFTQIEFI